MSSSRKSRIAARSRQAPASVQMAPMIDMVFLLLVFFMCVSSLSQAGSRVEVALPESSRSEVPADLSNRITLSVTEDGTVFVGSAPIPEESLAGMLSALSRGSPSQMKLYIRADGHATYESIQKVMRSAANAGISHIQYASYQID